MASGGQRGRNAAVSPKPVIGTYSMNMLIAMTLGALVPVGRACMRVSVFGLGKVAKPCQAMWSVIVVTI